MSGRLEEAGQLSCELYNAGTGHGSREFGMGAGLVGRTSSVWLPHNLLEWALKELEAAVTQDALGPPFDQVGQFFLFYSWFLFIYFFAFFVSFQI
jgi:hypothetical protein